MAHGSYGWNSESTPAFFVSFLVNVIPKQSYDEIGRHLSTHHNYH